MVSTIPRWVKSKVLADNPVVAASPTHAIGRAGTAPTGILPPNCLKVYAVPAVFTLALYEVMQPTNATNLLTLEV